MTTQHSTSPDLTTEIAIIGLGPVGATLANLLGHCGITTLVLEREGAAYHLPRAVHFDDEVMRVFETIGLSDAIAPLVTLSPGMHFVDPDGKLLLDWSRPAQITPQGWYPSYRFHQPDLERVLRDGITRYPRVSVRNRCDVYAIDSHADGVTIRFEDLATGKLQHCDAKYVVGCDGARSLVRRLIGSGMHDLGFHERWLVVDFLLQRPRPDLGDYSLQHCNPERPSTYIRGTGNRRRWEITLHPGEDPHVMVSDKRVWDLLSKWVGPDDGEIERAAVYTFHSVIAQSWRNGRLFLAGDSAHQTPPFLGQGMCAGIRDAANLAWKLAIAVRGTKSALDDLMLLDSYQSEREPHVREYIELAIKLGGVINTKAMSAAIPESSGETGKPAKMESKKPQLGAGLAAGDRSVATQLSPQPTLDDGRRLDQLIGYGFALVATPAFAALLSDAVTQQLHRANIALIQVPDREVQAWLSQLNMQAVLIRPDRYLLGGANSLADLQNLLAAISSGAQLLTVDLPANANP